MPNYNDNDTRDNSIDQLPRMTFQLPNTESGSALTTINPVFFCQQGCSIEYHFSNITSCQVNNDGKKFTITPTDTTNINYIMWNGTDINSGEQMTQFTLKEIYFTAPAKDYIGTNSDILSQSIQYYFVFVNEKYSNLMICVSVIGSVNNLGNAPKSNGFVMLETLSTRIPSVNVQSQISNLNNFNLGTLIPPNKPFFNTLITNNIQYIILTEIVDIPVEFFSNMATMVNGGTQLYTSKMNKFKINIPVNPSSTILFYNENSQSLDNDQSFVCNSNCDLVPGKKITPTVGKYTTVKSDKKPEPKNLTTISGTEVPPEKCETEEVWANQSLGKNASPPDSTAPSDTKPVDNTLIVSVTVSIMIIIVIGTGVGGYIIYKKYGNQKSIIFTVIGIISIIVGLSVGCGLFSKTTNYWIPYLVGLIIWLISLIFLYRIYRNYNSYGSSSYTSFDLQQTETIPQNQRYSRITIPTGFNQSKQQSWFSNFFNKGKSLFSKKESTDYLEDVTASNAQVSQGTGQASSAQASQGTGQALSARVSQGTGLASSAQVSQAPILSSSSQKSSINSNFQNNIIRATKLIEKTKLNNAVKKNMITQLQSKTLTTQQLNSILNKLKQ